VKGGGDVIFDIAVDYAEILKRKARWDKATALERPDRVPVLHYLGARFWLPLVGMGNGFRRYLEDPRLMLECQLKAAKWIFENVDSDFHKVACYPDFMWAEDIESFGAEFVYPEDDSPWVARPHLLQRDSDLEKLRGVDYSRSGIHGKMLEYYRKMKERAGDHRLRFRDGAVLEAVDCVYMGGAGVIGPMVTAGDLMGVEDLSLGFYDRPDYVRELLTIVAEKSAEWIDTAVEVSGGRLAFANDVHEGYVFIGDDGTAQMSKKLVEEFAKAPLRTLARHVHGKGLKVMAHNCGKADHLLDFWMDEVGIDRYIGFSYLTDKNRIREIMGGKIAVIGGIDTANLHDGTPESVREDVREALGVLRDVPGYIIMDGHNVAPGTPAQNLSAVTAAAREFGSF
jgi:uroporphyrinogen-III decarboxylase